MFRLFGVLEEEERACHAELPLVFTRARAPTPGLARCVDDDLAPPPPSPHPHPPGYTTSHPPRRRQPSSVAVVLESERESAFTLPNHHAFHAYTLAKQQPAVQPLPLPCLPACLLCFTRLAIRPNHFIPSFSNSANKQHLHSSSSSTTH